MIEKIMTSKINITIVGIFVLQLILILMKVTHNITTSWGITLTPIFIYGVIAIFFFTVIQFCVSGENLEDTPRN